jgi:hypothetical protein
MDRIILHDISLKSYIPNKTVFRYDDSVFDYVYKSETEESICIKRNFIRTTERFYRKGLIENVFFNKECILIDPIISDTYESINNDKNQIKPTQKLATKLCDYNWLLSFNLMSIYINELNSKLDFIQKKNIRLLNMGSGSCGFIGGIYYFLNNFVSLQQSISHNLNEYSFEWIGFDINNDPRNNGFLRLSKLIDNVNYKSPFNYKLIHGNIETYMISELRSLIECEFTDVNFIYNNIKPMLKNTVLISVIILSVLTLNSKGIMITKIPEPELWDTSFINHIILISAIFKTTKIFKFPVCKNQKIYYRYYLVGQYKKTIAYNDLIGIRLVYMLKRYMDKKEKYQNTMFNVVCLKLLLDDIIDADELNEWHKKIEVIKNINIDNLTIDLHKIINDLPKMKIY